jgi:IS30 family transposase
LIAKIQTLPEVLRKTLTWDQGSEMHEWKPVAMATDLDIYFCDPHAPWQRGSNENTNGLLRQYFPKGTDLSVHTATDLDLVAAELNDRPRKRFDYAKPNLRGAVSNARGMRRSRLPGHSGRGRLRDRRTDFEGIR